MIYAGRMLAADVAHTSPRLPLSHADDATLAARATPMISDGACRASRRELAGRPITLSAKTFDDISLRIDDSTALSAELDSRLGHSYQSQRRRPESDFHDGRATDARYLPAAESRAFITPASPMRC